MPTNADRAWSPVSQSCTSVLVQGQLHGLRAIRVPRAWPWGCQGPGSPAPPFPSPAGCPRVWLWGPAGSAVSEDAETPTRSSRGHAPGVWDPLRQRVRTPADTAGGCGWGHKGAKARQGVLSKVRGQKEEDDEESRDQRMTLQTEGTGVCSRRPWDWSPGALSLGSRWVPLHTWQEALAGAPESGRHTGSTFKIQTQTGKGQG